MTDATRVVRMRLRVVAVCAAAMAIWSLARKLLVQDRSRWHARGYAVVTYEPDSSVDGLNDAIGYVRDVAGAGIGALGPFAGGSWLANRVE